MSDIVDELREIQRMNTTLHGAQMAARAADEIERLRKERDEARRRLCRIYCESDTDWLSGPFPMETSTPEMFAKLEGWDCFKENA